jgi:rod shape-determining protein MreB
MSHPTHSFETDFWNPKPERPAATPAPATKNVILGLDFGTNTSCCIASYEGSREVFFKTAIPSVVGYPKELMIPGILPDGQEVFVGADALKHRAHLHCVSPMHDGIIADTKAARDFLLHLRQRIQPSGKIKAVVGMPARVSEKARDTMQDVLAGIFDQIILVPEPFLAALGYRNEKRLHEPQYADPVRSSLFVDIGAGTTDLCIIQGYYPSPQDLVSNTFAGDAIDALITEGLHAQYPEIQLSPIKVRSIKESFSYVGELKKGTFVKVLVGGKPRQIDVGPSVGQACNQLLDDLLEGIVQLITHCHPDHVEGILHNIVLTGGGSRIQGLAEELQARLAKEGYEAPRVSVVGEHYKSFVAIGAWKTAHTAKPQQWQHLLSKHQPTAARPEQPLRGHPGTAATQHNNYSLAYAQG